MKRNILLFYILMIPQLFDHLTAQPEIFGYYEGEVDQISAGNSDYFFGYNKVRIDLESAADNVTFWANVNVQLFHGRNEWNFLDFLPGNITQYFKANGIGEFPFALQDTVYLDNAYLMLNFPRFDLTIGKQQLSLGTGYVWNPLDIFNRKLLLDPTYEQTGINALRIEVPMADRVMLDAIVSPGNDWNSSARLIRGKVGLGRFDIAATIGAFEWNRTSLDLETFQEKVIAVNRKILGWDAVGEAIGWGIWTEGNWNIMDVEEDFLEYIIGFDHTFDFFTYLLVEYFHNGSAESEKKHVELDDYLSYFSGETHSIMQDYLFLFVNHPITDLLNIGLYGIANFNDGSAVISPLIEYSLFENVNASLWISRSWGDDNTEFGVQEWGVRLRLRTYF